MTIKFPDIAAPQAETRPKADNWHGISRIDEYAWLRADNWQEVFKNPSLLDPAIRSHLEVENIYQAAMMADTAELQKMLVSEMRGRIKEDDSSVPMKDGPFAYGTSFMAGGEQPRFFRTPRQGGEERILLDGDREAEGKSYFRLGSADHSPDHKLLLWGFDDKGSEFYTLHVREVESGTDSADSVRDTGGSGTWDADATGFFYTRLDANHRPSKIYYHSLGKKRDRLIYEEKDAGFFMDVGGTLTNRWIFIAINDHETSEYRILPANDPGSKPRLVAARETGLQYDLEDGGDIFFILTNADGAKDFKIMTAPVDEPGRANWRELIPHEPGRLILSVMAFENFLVRLERKEGLPRLVIRDRATGEEHMIAFEEEAYSLGLSGALEYDSDTIRFSYSSMTTPSQLFDYAMRTRERTLLKTQEVPSGHDAGQYVTRRLMAPAHDGELVPISLLHHKNTPLDGSAPCLLYGYGAYGITRRPSTPIAFRW